MTPQADAENLALVLLLHDWRFLRRDQVQTLLNTDASEAERILSQGAAAGFVESNAQVEISGLFQPVYALARRGGNLAASALGVDRAGLASPARRGAVGPLFLEHRLRINDIRLAFVRAARDAGQHGPALWRYERDIADRIPDSRRPGAWLPVRPDGYLAYRTPARLVHALVEADLGTVTNKRWAIRVQAYVAYRLGGAFRMRHGAATFRVLTVTTTQRRLRNLLRTTERAGGRSLFWFTTWDDLLSHSPLSPIWSVAGISSPSSATRARRGYSSRSLPEVAVANPSERGA